MKSDDWRRTLGLRPNAIGAALRRLIEHDGWIKPVLLVGCGLAIAIMFVHLFMLVMIACLLVFVALRLGERVLGPGTRIRFGLPPRTMAKLHAWLGRRK